ncbi:MAG: hypothetical protein ACRDDY_08115 [Clostridium sp.]|uniref:hypothetical protein n=1 Tax=Clostridium sp. TaxID=1506 RepID=UPI003EE52DC7
MFKGKIFYYEDIIFIFFEDNMEKLGSSSIFLSKNYSFIDSVKNKISLMDIVEEIFFCSLEYGKNYVSFKVKREYKRILKTHKLRFGDILLKEVKYITKKDGEIYDLCGLYDIELNDKNLELKDFEINFIDSLCISLISKDEIPIKNLSKDDFIFESNGYFKEIDYIRKNKLNDYTVIFKEEIVDSAKDKLVLKTRSIVKESVDALGRCLKGESMALISNKCNPNIKNISLVSLSENRIALKLLFDVDILRYSSNDFSLKFKDEKVLAKGEERYLGKGKEMILEIENISGVDIENPDIYIRTEEIKNFYTIGYNKTQIKRFEFKKIESLYGKDAVLKLGLDSILRVMFGAYLKQLDNKSVEYLIKIEEEKIILENKEYGSITFYYEEDIEIANIVEARLEGIARIYKNTLEVVWSGQIIEKFKGFVYVDYIIGEKIESESEVVGIRNYAIAVEIEEEFEEIIYSKADNFGENWILEGKLMSKPVVIEIDNSVEYRYYGNLLKRTQFDEELKFIYVYKEEGNLEVDVDIYNFQCNNVIVDIDDNIKINFIESNIKSMIKL